MMGCECFRKRGYGAGHFAGCWMLRSICAGRVVGVKRPIEVSEIRRGDLIRWEAVNKELAHEWRADMDRETLGWNERGTFFLLERPEPAVELPTEPTLGWLEFTAANGGQAKSLATWRFEHTSMDDSTHAKNEWGSIVADIDEKVTAFTSATAVPTAAVDDLRIAADGTERGLMRYVERFLAAVDEANA